MVGFVDNEAQTHIENDLKDLQDFIKLPGGRMIPAIAKHVCHRLAYHVEIL